MRDSALCVGNKGYRSYDDRPLAQPHMRMEAHQTAMTEHDATSAPGSLPTKIFVYISRAAPDLTPDGLYDLLLHCRRANALDGLHGLLSHDRRGFLQVLEGTQQSVDSLLARIREDPRHRDMQILLNAPTVTPQFFSFFDIVCEEDEVASLDMLHPRSFARLSPDIVRVIEQGYAQLDQD